MRIILVNKFHYMKGGSETYYFAVADALREMGHEVHYFAMEDEKNVPCEDSDLFVPNRDYNGPSSPVAKASAALSIVYSSEAKRRFQVLCERVRPDIVHLNLVHRQITLSILDAAYLAQHKVPVVWTAHDYIAVCPSYTMLDGADEVCEACLGGRFSNCLKRKCVKGSATKSGMAMLEAEFLRRTRAYDKIDRVICPSRFLAGKMVEGGFPESQIVWMPNFVADEPIEAAGRAKGPGCDGPYLLYFGRLSAEKGVDVLIGAFSEIVERLPGEWRLKVAGTGPAEAPLRALAESSAASSRIEFLGFKAGGELASLVKGARWSVAPSTWRENMPYSIVESLAAGTPVVGARIGGIPELVREGETGLLAEPGDASSLADAILRAVELCGDTGAYRAMQSRCRSFVLENCDQERYVKKLVSLYRELVEQRDGAADAQE